MNSPEERLATNSLPITESGCLVWLGRTNDQGYGKLNRSGRTIFAHRLAFELANGPIPEGLVVDHLCRVRCCINPKHMELVTRGENVRRSPIVGKWKREQKTVCLSGHDYSGDNVRYEKSGKRYCLQCKRDQSRQWHRLHSKSSQRSIN